MIPVHCKYDDLLHPKDLSPTPNNTNDHPPEQIEILADIIEYQGWRHPVVVSKLSGNIVAGHGRRLAALDRKWMTVPVVFQDFESPEQEYAFLESDNHLAELSEHNLDLMWDNLKALPALDLKMLGIPDLEMPDVPVHQSPGCDDDDTPEAPEKPTTRYGDRYRLGNHYLMCGDSTLLDDVDRLMNGNKADMVFTDPPYGISIVQKNGTVASSKLAKSGHYTPVIGDETTETAIDSFNLSSSICSGPLIFWGANHYSSSLPDSSCWIVWDKENSGEFADAELAWTNQKTAVRIFKHMWNGMIKASEHGQKRVHPTQKPIALAEWCFKEYGNVRDNVLDLFGGSGSTLIACEKTNRKCFMMELDPGYCDVIIARFEKFSGKKAELLQGGHDGRTEEEGKAT